MDGAARTGKNPATIDAHDGSAAAPVASLPFTATFGPRVLFAGLSLVSAYLWVALGYHRTIGGRPLGPPMIFGLVVATSGLLAVAIRLAARKGARRNARMFDWGIVAASLGISLAVGDLGFAWLRGSLNPAGRGQAESFRAADSVQWHGEVSPRRFVAPEADYLRYKPNTYQSADTYGDFYYPRMLRSRTLADSVLELHRRSYFIGPHGLRERGALAAARVFALGDSYTMGYSTDEGKGWTAVASTELGEPVYNLGVATTGPRLQLNLLRAMLAKHADSMRVERLIWMVYEGNDLEDPYPEDCDRAGSCSLGPVWKPLAAVLDRFERVSVFRQLVSGELNVGRMGTIDGDRLQFDGIGLTAALYHSPRLGYQMFNIDEVRRAVRPRSYVLEHPNVERLKRAFGEMRALADKHGFRVTVVTAPSAPRLVGSEFDGFPRMSAAPHFTDFVLDLARRQHFETVDLLPLMKPAAAREPLYYRDDHHWNERGNAIAGQIVAAAVRDRLSPSGLMAAEGSIRALRGVAELSSQETQGDQRQ